MATKDGDGGSGGVCRTAWVDLAVRPLCSYTNRWWVWRERDSPRSDALAHGCGLCQRDRKCCKQSHNRGTHSHAHPPCDVARKNRKIKIKMPKYDTAAPSTISAPQLVVRSASRWSHSSDSRATPMPPNLILCKSATSMQMAMSVQTLVSVAWSHGSSRQSHGSAVITGRCLSSRAVAQR